MSEQPGERFVRRFENFSISGRAKVNPEANVIELQKKDEAIEPSDSEQEIGTSALDAELVTNAVSSNADDLQSEISAGFLCGLTMNFTAAGKLSSYLSLADDEVVTFWNDYIDEMKAIDGYKMKVNKVFCINGLHTNPNVNSLGNHYFLMHGVHHSAVFDLLEKNFNEHNGIGSRKSYFGRGFIFTDCSTKAFNFASHSKAYEYERKADEGNFQPEVNDVGYILACDVALGTILFKRTADKDAPRFMTQDSYCTDSRYKVAKENIDSLVDDSGHIVSLPRGGFVKNREVHPKDRTTIYSEYSVYNANQIEMKWLLEVERIA